MLAMSTPISRPRVYLIDFEMAVEFPEDSPLDECTCTGFPLPETFSSGLNRYARVRLPEFTSGKPYDPFKLDVAQLRYSFADLKPTVSSFFFAVFTYTPTLIYSRQDSYEINRECPRPASMSRCTYVSK